MTAILWGLMGGMGGTAWVPPSTPAAPPPGEAVKVIPDPYKPMVARLRPQGDAIATYQVGPGRTYERIVDAIDHGTRVQAATGGGRIDIVIDPGTYADEPEGLAFHDAAFYSASGEPRSVTVLAGMEGAGAPFYVEGLVLDPRGLHGSKYGIHAAVVDATAVMVGSALYYSASDIGSGWPMGTDGGDNGYWLLWDVDLYGIDEGSRTNNHHAIAQGTGRAPFTMVYVNVRSNGGLQFDGMWQGQPDELWVIDSTAAWAAMSQATAGKVYISGSTLGPAPAWSEIQPVDRRDWPLPDGTRA